MDNMTKTFFTHNGYKRSKMCLLSILTLAATAGGSKLGGLLFVIPGEA